MRSGHIREILFQQDDFKKLEQELAESGLFVKIAFQSHGETIHFR
jgi:hypothetical protein